MGRAARMLTALLALLVVVAAGTSALTAPGRVAAAQEAEGAPGPLTEVADAGPDMNDGKPLPLDVFSAPETVTVRPPQRAARAPGPPAGTRRWWPSYDSRSGFYLKEYALRAGADGVEVWVATGGDATSSGLEFPPGDCRNGVRTTVTDAQAAHLAAEYGRTVRPVTAAAFGTAPPRRGAEATLPGLVGLPADYYAGDGDVTVVLVDNVRDENFYDAGNANRLPYTAGFFSSQIGLYTDRNVVTLDGFDWRHRTTASPPDEPAATACAHAPARPWFVEGTLAHEYQHLLHDVADADETPWLNEGLSDVAQVLTGYTDPSIPATRTGYDAHVQCLLGALGVPSEANAVPRPGGPENSLTRWGDQGDAELLCDYGAASTFLLHLQGRWGTGVLTGLHRDARNGLESVQGQLDVVAPGTSVRQVIDDWAAMLAVDAELDAGGGLRTAVLGDAGDLPLPLPDPDGTAVRAPALAASVFWQSSDAYDTPGAPPNGTDFVRLLGADGTPLRPNQVRTLSFEGAATHPAEPVEWTVGTDVSGRAGNAVLASGSGPELDRAIVRAVGVPAGAPTLRFDTLYQIETGFDVGLVQVSPDGGASWTTVAGDRTSPVTDATVQGAGDGSTLDGLTGDSGGWVRASYDLSAWAGQEVLIAFRYVTDRSVDLPGWWIDDVTVGEVAVADGSTLEGWRSPTQVRPAPVAGWSAQLVAYSTTDPAVSTRIGRVAVDADGVGAPAQWQVRALVRDNRLDVVGVLVTVHDPSEEEADYVPYRLTVNGVVQPGG